MSVGTFKLKSGRTVKLGRIKPKARPKALPFAHYLKAAPVLPAMLDYSVKALPALKETLGNTDEGDCVIASIIHAIGIWTGNATGTPAIGTTAEALAQYKTICGPGDNGCVITDVLDYAQTHGITVGGKVHKIGGYASVNWQAVQELQAAILLFGAVKIGFDVMQRWENEDVWDINPGGFVAGGHDVPLIGWNAKGFILASWGELFTMTFAAATSTKYLDEAYVPISIDILTSSNVSFSGFDFSTLQTDLQLISGGQFPPLNPTPVPPSPTPSPTPVPPSPTPSPTPTPTPSGLTLSEATNVVVQGIEAGRPYPLINGIRKAEAAAVAALTAAWPSAAEEKEAHYS